MTEHRERNADVAALFAVAGRDWWRYVPCPTCWALRQEQCRTLNECRPRASPHAARYRAGLTLHATLWLLAHHPEDVLGPTEGT